MTVVAFGVVMDALGQGLQDSHRRNRHGAWSRQRRVWATPAHEVRARQAADIPVDIDHDGVAVGRVQHLERSRDGKLWAVAALRDFDPPERPVYFSPSMTFDRRDGSDVLIESIALVAETAMIGSSPVEFLEGHIEYADAVDRWSSSVLERSQRAMLERAAGHHFRRGPIVVHDAGAEQVTRLPGGVSIGPDGEPLGVLETRPASVAWAPRGGGGERDGRPPGELQRGRGGRILSVR